MDVEPDFGQEFYFQLVQFLYTDSPEFSDYSVVIVNVILVLVGYRYRSQNQPILKVSNFLQTYL